MEAETDSSVDNAGSEAGPPALKRYAVIPEKENASALPVVGIGASAGGIAALQAFFTAASADTGMAFVVVLHLSPDHESHLPQVLQRSTAMPVISVDEPVRVEANHVYVISPAKHLEMVDGILHPRDFVPVLGRRVVIDQFFRTLAEAHGPEATCVILSGTGDDGSLGLKMIKELGGLTVAQEPEDAEYDGMPRSAVATGMVDYVLPSGEIARQIFDYYETSRRMRVPEEAAPSPKQRDECPDAEVALREILAHLRTQTGHDFARYKRATVLRRIARRLQVHGLEDLSAYLGFLRRNPAEVGALLNDLLICVTQFFRDPDIWKELEEEILPHFFENRRQEDTIRAWVCGCATGEEAYTLAILLAEQASLMDRPPQIQIFATDMSDEAIAQARLGRYPETILGDMTPERLRRWFDYDQGGLRVKKQIRDTVLFASHDVLKDTPFSRLDLVTCRNLLIYLNSDAQQAVFELFHFALRPGGRLFLGTSESAETQNPLFSPTHKSNRLYMRLPVARLPPPLPTSPARPAGTRRISAPPALGAPVDTPASLTVPTLSNGIPSIIGATDRPLSVAEFHRGLLELYAPPSILIGEDQEIIHLSEQAGKFLRVSGGEPTTNLLRLVHPALRLELRAALYAAAQEGQDQARIVRASLDPAAAPIDIRLVVRPVRLQMETSGYFLVLFEENTDRQENGAAGSEMGKRTRAVRRAASVEESRVITQLEQETNRLQVALRSTVEQHDASVEELKASNEELQSMNEEMRSTAEELETSREELQSVNEELSTVNHELKVRVEEVGRANTDLQNLLAATEIATIFLDREMRIQRYTPPAEALFNVIGSDLGRPLMHLTHRLNYPNLADDAERVLARLAVVEREVSSEEGRWYLSRLLPYRTLDHRIDGVVITLVDITRQKEDTQALIESEERFRLLVEGAEDYAMFLIDPGSKITFWSAGAQRIYGWTEAEILGQTASVLFTPEDRQLGEPAKEMQEALRNGRAEDRRWHLRKDGSRFWADGLLMRLDEGNGDSAKVRGFAKVTRDATEQGRIEEELKRGHDELEARVIERTTELKSLNTRLHIEGEQRKLLVERVVNVQEEERRRLSRELHDQAGQLLAGGMLRLKSLQDSFLEDPRLQESIAPVQSLLQELGKELHHLAVELRPTALDDLGLSTALGNYVEQWSERSGIAVDYHSNSGNGQDAERLPMPVETALYRIAQEALTNILKHAQATSVSIVLERRAGQVQLIVEDNGIGFDRDAVDISAGQQRHLGLIGMQERSQMVGGTLLIESSPGGGTSAPGGGTSIFVRVPLT